MPTTTRRRLVLPAVAIAMTCVPLRAHEVVVEQIAKVIVAPHANQLDVRVEIPVTLLNDAGLARHDDGRIDPGSGGTVLQTIAVDVARNLDMRRDGVALPVTRATAELGADGRSVDVNVIYALAGPSAGLSARLNAFQGTALRPPRTEAIYLASPDRPQHMTLTGPPARVSFDPDRAEAFRQAAGRAFDQILSGAGDHLLFLICLLLPTRPARESALLVGAVLAAQAAGMVASPILQLAMGVPLLAAQTVASSAVVAGALCAIVGTSWRTLAAISCVFGLLSGVEFGATFESIRPFAGSHGWLALLTFSLVGVWRRVVARRCDGGRAALAGPLDGFRLDPDRRDGRDHRARRGPPRPRPRLRTGAGGNDCRRSRPRVARARVGAGNGGGGACQACARTPSREPSPDGRAGVLMATGSSGRTPSPDSAAGRSARWCWLLPRASSA